MKHHFSRAGISAIAAFTLCPAAALADSMVNSAAFDNVNTLTASVLNATVANSSVSFQPASSTIGGNVLKGVFNNSVGVIGVVQNTGSNSNVQQSMVVTINGAAATVTH